MHKYKNICIAVLATILSIHTATAGATEDLWQALKQADYTTAIISIQAGADVKSEDATFGSPLNFAACWADAEVINALIAANANINYVAPTNGHTPLMNAAAWGNTAVVKILIDAKADLNVKNKLGQTILAVAIGSSKLSVVELLVNAGANPLETYQLATIKDQTLLNALMSAMEPTAKIANIKTIQTSLSGMGITFPPRLSNATELDYSSTGSIAKYILDKGVNPNQTVLGTWGNILNQAIDFGKIDVAKELIMHGAISNPEVAIKVKSKLTDTATFPNVTYTNGDYMLIAILSGDLDFVKFMAEKYPDLIQKKYEGDGFIKCNSDKTTSYFSVKGVSLLMIAAEHGNPVIVKYLFDKGFDKDDFVEAKWQMASKRDTPCIMLTVRRTMGYAKTSGNAEVIAMIKSAGIFSE